MRKILFFVLGSLVLVLALEIIFIFSRKPSKPSNISATVPSRGFVSTVVVPHFEGAREDRVKYIEQIAQSGQFDRIILTSTNHYNTGASNIISTRESFDFKEAKTVSDEKVVKSLVDFAGATDNKNAFLNEHGISSVLPEVNRYLAPKNITPVIFKESISKAEVDKVFNALKDTCSSCLIIASIDFSHYNPSSLAQIHDQMSLGALEDLNENKAWQAETDSQAVLYLAVKWAKSFEGQNFSLYKHSNSGLDQKNETAETTSYILGSFSDKNKKLSDKKTTFIFAGDMMLDRYVYHRFKNKLNDVFSSLGNRVFWGTDISFLNNEGPISKDAINDDYTANNLIFNFPPETTKTLNFLHVNGVSLANNHSLNAGKSGFENTKTVLADAGVKNCGAQNIVNDSSVVRYDSDIPISIICFNQLENPKLSQVANLIQAEKEAKQFVIVYPHWGNEYQQQHNSAQQSLAENLIDAGADMIIGSHPHVVQDFDIYKGRPIIYSLGNLVFDQSFSRETQQGLIVAGTISGDGLEISFLPTKQVNLKVELESDPEAKQARIRQVLDINSQSGFTKLSGDTIKITK